MYYPKDYKKAIHELLYNIYIPLLTFLDTSIGFTFNIVNMLNYYIMCNGIKVVLNKHIESIKNQNLSVIFRKKGQKNGFNDFNLEPSIHLTRQFICTL